MFDAWCDAHGARVLVTPGQIRGIDNLDDAIVVTFRCVCGHHGTWQADRRRPRVHAAS